MNCPYCGKPAKWVSNELIYGKKHGKSYMIYWCETCDARVGCHNNTTVALGTMANKELREWRIKAHKAIDGFWKSKLMSRSAVYAMLNERFGKEVHIGEADIDMCKQIIAIRGRG